MSLSKFLYQKATHKDVCVCVCTYASVLLLELRYRELNKSLVDDPLT